MCITTTYPSPVRPAAEDAEAKARIFRFQCLAQVPRGDLSFEEWLFQAETLYQWATYGSLPA